MEKHKITLSNRDRATHISVILTLSQIMACRLFDAKPLYEPMLLYIVNWTLGNKRQWHLNQNEQFSYKKMYIKIASVKCWPICIGLNTLMATIFSHWCNFNVAFGELSPINLKSRNGVKHFLSANRLASVLVLCGSRYLGLRNDIFTHLQYWHYQLNTRIFLLLMIIDIGKPASYSYISVARVR